MPDPTLEAKCCICDRRCPATEDRHWVNCPAHQYYPAYIALATPATEQPGGEAYRAGVAAGLEKAAGIAEATATRAAQNIEVGYRPAHNTGVREGAETIRAAIRQEIGK